MKNSSFAAALLLGLALPLSGYAVDGGVPDGLSLCQYYLPDVATLAPITSELSEVAKGSRIVFRGTLIHSGSLPLTDATLYVKVVSTVESRVVALLPVSLALPIEPGNQTMFEVAWDVPKTLTPGAYSAESIVYLNGRYASKATFDRSVFSPYPFTVVGEPPDSISFDLEAVSINGDRPSNEGGTIRAPQDGSLIVSVPIINGTSVPLKTEVQWTLYAWDGPRRDREIGAFRSEVKVHAHKIGTTQFMIPDTSETDYFLEGTMDVRGEPLVVYVRISRLGYRVTKLSAAGVALSKIDGRLTAYACVVSPDAPSDQVRVELRSASHFLGVPYTSKTVTYEGSIPQGVEYALATPLSENEGTDVSVSLYHGNELVDTIDVNGTSLDKAAGGYAVFGAALLLVVGLLVVWYRRRNTV